MTRCNATSRFNAAAGVRAGMLAFAFTLAGCASTAPAALPPPQSTLHAGAYAQLTLHPPQQPAARFNFIWRHLTDAADNRRDEVDIKNALGSTIARLTLSPAGAVLEYQDKKITTEDSRELANRVIGQPLPVQALGHWLRGMPAPAATATTARDVDGRISEINQYDWNIKYLLRDADNNPQKITLRSADGLRVEVKIRRWLR